MTPARGRRGSRSDARPIRPTPAATAEPPPPPAPTGTALPVARVHRARDWIGPVLGLTVGLVLGYLGRELAGGRLEAVALAAALVTAAWLVLRRRPGPLPRRAPVGPLPAAPQRASPVRLTALDQGVLALRRTDPNFDATRFAGYAAMTFRDVQSARMARDAGGLRDRLTGAMYADLEAGCSRLRASGRSARYAAIEISSEVTEAWQDGDRDYVTAFVGGSMSRHTVDDATGRVVDGGPAAPAPVEAFLTFTRPAGLNFWMLSIIQGA